MPKTCQKHAKNMPKTFQKHFKNIWAQNMSNTCQNNPKACQKHAKNMPKTCQKHLEKHVKTTKASPPPQPPLASRCRSDMAIHRRRCRPHWGRARAAPLGYGPCSAPLPSAYGPRSERCRSDMAVHRHRCRPHWVRARGGAARIWAVLGAVAVLFGATLGAVPF